MKTLVAVILTTLLLAACGESGDDIRVDPEPYPPRPTAPPAPTGEVHTGLVYVMDKAGSPEVCLGSVAESWPPQCSGPALAGWDWAEHPEHEEQGSSTWGSFAITGSWDGATLTAESAVSGALYDPAAIPERPQPTGAASLTQTERDAIAQELEEALPGYLASHATESGVLADVVYDDGSLQSWADQTYGADVVQINSALTAG